MENDTIYRQDAIDALSTPHGILYPIRTVEELPSAQPTLYGYTIEHLAFAATIMKKEGVNPEEAVTIFRDVNRVIEMMIDEMEEMQKEALCQIYKADMRGNDHDKS